MIWFGLRRIPSCAYLMAPLLLLSIGSDSPITAMAATAAEAQGDQTKGDAAQTPAAQAPAEAAPARADSPAKNAAGGFKISGRVLFKGTPPVRRVINMSKDAKCIELHGDKQVLDEDLIVSSSGGVKNGFVRVQRGAPKKDYPMPEKPAVLSQKDCMFQPRVQGVRVGQRLVVGNDDPVTHNVRSFPTMNPAFNFGQPPATDPRERIFERAEREIEIQCDFHLWMHAFIFVMDHPFYCVSGDDGAYAIEGLPPGEYTLETWHEKLGKKRSAVTVGSEDLSNVDFTFSR